MELAVEFSSVFVFGELARFMLFVLMLDETLINLNTYLI